ncbi:MAG: PEP-CTERM sorting domain-containing protein [Sedimentisphaerales bacterium]|nr:PEP-CTERM sorting domain-containing protein [Sedimentisphaerales bacterium]
MKNKTVLIVLYVVSIWSSVQAGLYFTLEPTEIPQVSELSMLLDEASNIWGFLVSIEVLSDQAILDRQDIIFPAEFDLPGKISRVEKQGQYIHITAAQGGLKRTVSGPAVLMEGLKIHWQEVQVPFEIIAMVPPESMPGISGTIVNGQVVPGETVLFQQTIPEPATFVLLGLGGLLIRRKKGIF